MKTRKSKRNWIFILLMISMSYYPIRILIQRIYDQYQEEKLELSK
ncbi:MAG: hypothetical protein PHC43_02645 [Candidatus Marinimicrobia bacterium]|nr:hypothetical protein [Candidatus Neomarinimicrobiota bacterium]MDD5230201.1 hypothetical protein [Candidatus Neomarinimicrobiota bacterium]